MTTPVFIGGSRRVSTLAPAVCRRLDTIMRRNSQILIGDANGADKTVQAYLHERRYGCVQVFCVQGTCRNNLGGWAVRAVPPPHRTKDAAYYTAKDIVMAGEASVGFMLWDGESLGTLANVVRLLRRGKPTLVYSTSDGCFTDVRTEADLDRLMAQCPAGVRERLDTRLKSVVESGRAGGQFTLF